ncbi:hypothetical protein Poli38472_007038 [Pythium oligandrum]|uniref:HECT-type E3 ubiquitin transferase n=1 Tax=Pythium oligandrum TaxID=41045 RepID=A0A8K1C9H1_PYTOL|nr:hypothetical protein Poli38472_007038 [Pythium oligandrum]|eukprot:TMW58893.1 hypothetical protein Poli38472_007038 [Pythium oligandrum]
MSLRGRGASEDSEDDVDHSVDVDEEQDPELDAIHRRYLQRQTSDTSSNGGVHSSSRLLEALEALSTEAGGNMPQSLRGLLGQLQGNENAMAGLFPFMQLLEHSGQPRFQRILQSLDPDAPIHAHMSGLSELCESLSMSSEEVLVMSGFSVDKFLPPVLHLVRTPSTMEVLLMAARALSSMLDLFPGIAVPKAMGNDTLVVSLCEKLLEIEYMDVAEVAFQILERIVCKSDTLTQAGDYRRAVIRANGFVALLQFVDFFPIENQRTAARVVAGLCTNLPVQSLPELQGALPLIVNLLRSTDREILQQGCESFQRLGESAAFGKDATMAKMVASDETCQVVVQLLEKFTSEDTEPNNRITPAGCSSILRFLSAVLSSPHGSSSEGESNDFAAMVDRLRYDLLPPLVAKLLTMESVLSDIALLRETLKTVIVILPSREELMTTKRRVINPHDEEATLAFTHQILSSIIGVYEATGRKEVRYDCLGVIHRISLIGGGGLNDGHQDQSRRTTLELGRLAAFLARVLRPAMDNPVNNGKAPSSERAKDDLMHLHIALQIVEVCLQSDDREALLVLFERYGVTAAIRFYAAQESSQDKDDLVRIQHSANDIVEEFLSGKESVSISSATGLVETVSSISDAIKSSSSDRSAQILESLQSLRALGRDNAQSSVGVWLTAHEISSSGLSQALIQLLKDVDGRRIFADVFLRGSVPDGSVNFVSCLVNCIQDSISSEKDAFRVDSVPHSTDTTAIVGSVTTGSVGGDLDQLAQHIKVKVIIEENEGASEELTSDFRRNKMAVHDTVVLVEPLARIETIEEFIGDKLFGSRSLFDSLDDSLSGRNSLEHDEAEEKESDDEEDELRNDGPRKEKKLQVWYHGSMMRSDASVLEAILKGPPAADASVLTSTLTNVWSSSPHEFTFRVLASSTSKIEEQSRNETPVAQATSSEDVSSKWWDDVWDLLDLLKHIYELARSIREAEQAGLKFVNQYICLQVRRALLQPIRVVTNSLPAWCHRIVESFPFVLSYDMRYHFMYATACGSSRAIQYMCRTLWNKAVMEEPVSNGPLSARGSSGSGRRRNRERGTTNRLAPLQNLARMVKLPRLKVRVSRGRLLQSAMKLFSIYGGKKAIIEIEFLGEVGTGLGPTTEFYTLVCQEIQATKLRLWRSEKEPPVEERPSKTENASDDGTSDENKEKSGLPVRGYHRIAVYHCTKCKHLQFPRCSIHDQLLTHEKKTPKSTEDEDASEDTIPQCASCLDSEDWSSQWVNCRSCYHESAKSSDVESDAASSEETQAELQSCSLKWWILSDEEVQYLCKVYPRDTDTVKHPVLQCSHCDTVNFPGTDAGIVVLEGERMISRSGRRMYERDYRAVTKHVSPLCEGTPLSVINVVLTRNQVEALVDCVPKSPEVLESEIESLSYLAEATGPGEVEVVDAPFGLYPKSYTPDYLIEEKKKRGRSFSASSTASSSTGRGGRAPDVLTWYNFIGRFFAQAILDERLLNLPLSKTFLRALRSEDLVGDQVNIATSIEYVSEFDPAIGNSLSYLHKVVGEHHHLKAQNDGNSSRIEELAKEVESMCLAFTLVGDSTIPLRADGGDVDVTLDNLDEYVKANVEFLLDVTIRNQVDAFFEGFQTIAKYDGRRLLQSFSIEELESMLTDRTVESMWDRDGKELREHMVCDHGYSSGSRAINDLVAILCEMSLAEQRQFVRFVTGADRLPLGGLGKLDPKLTVVRKLGSGGDDENMDAVLPSASTCTNYLKLPEYSTREIMKERLMYCIQEGQGSFHLS